MYSEKIKNNGNRSYARMTGKIMATRLPTPPVIQHRNIKNEIEALSLNTVGLESGTEKLSEAVLIRLGIRRAENAIIKKIDGIVPSDTIG